ncbi:NusA-like transcription termination signal-binding factor [Candidatus Woesearchaeota archaeon]|nr:NusA-like transcription termination signal-binding factor [Candidatus Woesearchaeota archaeon]
MEKKISGDTLKIMSLFEKITRTGLKDCFEDKNKLLTFIVLPGRIRNAVGPKGANVKKMEGMINRKIKIVEFNSELVGFVKNLIYPLGARNIFQEENIVTIESQDHKTRGLLIGRNASNLRNFEAIVKKYYPQLEELKVL